VGRGEDCVCIIVDDSYVERHVCLPACLPARLPAWSPRLSHQHVALRAHVAILTRGLLSTYMSCPSALTQGGTAAGLYSGNGELELVAPRPLTFMDLLARRCPS